jgi:NADPH:quinone reductase
MRAAVVKELGRAPEVEEVPEPEAGADEVVLEVLASSLNPIDINVGAGRFYDGHPELPYVPGAEAVGRVADDGRVVWASGQGMGTKRNGGLAERAVVPASAVIPVPDGAEPQLAVALGVAGLAGWLPLAWRAPVQPGETVLVLGASGAVGLVAVQTAKLLGAGRVVAAGRRPEGLARAEELGADAAVRLDEPGDLVAAFRDACGGEGPSLVADPLWGEPLEAAVAAAAPSARLVNIGQSAGPKATLASGDVRGKQLQLLGYSNFSIPPEIRAREYERLVRHAVAGDVRLDLERVPLDQVAEAWERQARGAGTKIVIVP